MSGKRVFLGGLSNRATDSDVERFFKGFGRIRDINLKQGYGFVEFEDARDADDAVYEMNNQNLCGSRVTVEHSKGERRAGGGGGYGGRSGGFGGDRNGRPSYGGGGYRGRDDRGFGGRTNNRPYNTQYRVLVENLSSRCGWQDLKDHLRQGGEVTYAEAHQYIKGEGMVDFATKDDMKHAIDRLDDSELFGRRIRLIEEKSRRSVSRSPSRSPVRSRSRSRSRSPMSRGRY